MPGNLRYGLTSGLSTASKKRRPGSHYLESPFYIPNTDQNCTPFHFISRLGFDSAPSQQRKQAPNERRGATAQVPRAGVEKGFLFCRKRCLGGFPSFRFDFIMILQDLLITAGGYGLWFDFPPNFQFWGGLGRISTVASWVRSHSLKSLVYQRVTGRRLLGPS